MISQPLNKNCPVCGGYVYVTDIGAEICQSCGYVIPLATFATTSTDYSHNTAGSAYKYCNNCKTKMEKFGDTDWWECPNCHYGYMDYIGDPPKDNLFIPCDNAWGVGYAHGSLEPDPFTVEIGNCKTIKLGHKELDINFEFDAKKIENIDTIIINGHKFVRER